MKITVDISVLKIAPKNVQFEKSLLYLKMENFNAED